MEPPAKRVRVGHAPWDDDDDEEANDDELTLSASQFDARQDPMYQLDKKRAKSVFKLKSRFEDIFEKYGKHFEGIGDEIDLRTGEIVIDNGHLKSLEDEDEDQDKSEDEQEAARAMQERGTIPRNKLDSSVKGRPASGHTPRMLQIGLQQPAAFTPLEALGAAKLPFIGNNTVEPAWQTPEMQSSLQSAVGSENRGHDLSRSFNNEQRSSIDYPGFGMGSGLFDALQRPYRRIASAKDIAPKPLPMSVGDGANQDNDLENDSGDDVLLGTEETVAAAAPRPHLKKPFKAVANSADGSEKTASNQKMESEIRASRPNTNSSRRLGRPKRVPTSPPRIVEADDAGSSKLAADRPNVVLAKMTSRVSNGKSETTEKDMSIQARMQEQMPTIDDSSDSQSRRSGRVRKEVDRYSQIAWANTRRKIENAMTPPETDTEESLILKDSASQLSRSPKISAIENIDWSSSGTDKSLGDQTIGHVDPITRIVGRAPTVPDSPFIGDMERVLTSSEAPSPSLRQLPYADSKSLSFSKAEPSPGQEIGRLGTSLEQAIPVRSSVEANTDTLSACSNNENLIGMKTQILDQERAVESVERLRIGERISYAGSIADSECVSEFEQADPEVCADADVSVELGEATGPNIIEPSREETSNLIKPSSEPAKTPDPEVVIEIGGSPHQSNSPNSMAQKMPTSSPRVLRPQKGPQSRSAQIPVRSSLNASDENKQPPEPTPVNDLSQSPSQPRSRPSGVKLQPNFDLKTPKKKRVISSLLANVSDDEDEVSILSSSVARTPASNGSLRASFVRSRPRVSSATKRSPSRTGQQSNIASSPHGSNISTGSKRYASPSLPRMAGTDTGAIRYGLKWEQSTAGLAQSSPLSRSLSLRKSQRSSHQEKTRGGGVASPTDDSILKPGGTMGRCGEDGFVCDRDFCFTCCK